MMSVRLDVANENKRNLASLRTKHVCDVYIDTVNNIPCKMGRSIG